MSIAAIVSKLCTVKVENSVNARSASFCQIQSQMCILISYSSNKQESCESDINFRDDNYIMIVIVRCHITCMRMLSTRD